MHSLRCLRLIQMRTLIIIGALSLLLTFFILIFSGDINQKEKRLFYSRHFSHKKVVGIPSQVSSVVDHNKDDFWKDNRPPLSVPRVAKYCNIPHDQFPGQEGLVPAGYKLLNVHVVIRHGDRAPIVPLINNEEESLSCVVSTAQYSHLPKVTNYVQVMEAGHRTLAKQTGRSLSFNRWPLYPIDSVCDWGQLTGQGAVQHILNGLHLSERYVHKHNLLDSTNWGSQIRVHSTKLSRTYQSAVAFMYGLLPSFDIEKLNVRASDSLSFCEGRVFGSLCACPGVDHLRNKAMQECKMSETTHQNESMSALLNEFRSLQAHVGQVLETNHRNDLTVNVMMDGMSKYVCHSIPLPCNAKGLCLTSKTIERVWKMLDATSECLAKNPSNLRHSRVLMHGLLFRIAREFSVSRNNGTNPRFHLYSGHDTTLTPLIQTLGLKDIVWPGYASRITFELYRKENTNEHFIRILQNGRVVTSEVTFCQKNIQEDNFCNFDFFVKFVEENDLKKMCTSFSVKKRRST